MGFGRFPSLWDLGSCLPHWRHCSYCPGLLEALGAREWRKGGEKKEKRENVGLPHFLWILGDPFPAPWVRTRGLLVVLFLSMLIMLTSKFQDTLSSGWGVLEEEKNGKLTAGSVVLWILVFFPNLPPTIYFSESSNSHSKHSVQVL